ncbi:hypothetical protein DFJ77DRAFT_360512 [Powellomyces hirtus]|nr:hypothetical protein DFJ77DRAFT_360512 [Powellomyces hirtus]
MGKLKIVGLTVAIMAATVVAILATHLTTWVNVSGIPGRRGDADVSIGLFRACQSYAGYSACGGDIYFDDNEPKKFRTYRQTTAAMMVLGLMASFLALGSAFAIAFGYKRGRTMFSALTGLLLLATVFEITGMAFGVLMSNYLKDWAGESVAKIGPGIAFGLATVAWIINIVLIGVAIWARPSLIDKF